MFFVLLNTSVESRYNNVRYLILFFVNIILFKNIIKFLYLNTIYSLDYYYIFETLTKAFYIIKNYKIILKFFEFLYLVKSIKFKTNIERLFT